MTGYLGKYDRECLLILAEELGINMEANSRKREICKAIINEPDYNESFTKNCLECIMEEKELERENKLRELELEKIRLTKRIKAEISPVKVDQNYYVLGNKTAESIENQENVFQLDARVTRIQIERQKITKAFQESEIKTQMSVSKSDEQINSETNPKVLRENDKEGGSSMNLLTEGNIEKRTKSFREIVVENSMSEIQSINDSKEGISVEASLKVTQENDQEEGLCMNLLTGKSFEKKRGNSNRNISVIQSENEILHTSVFKLKEEQKECVSLKKLEEGAKVKKNEEGLGTELLSNVMIEKGRELCFGNVSGTESVKESDRFSVLKTEEEQKKDVIVDKLVEKDVDCDEGINYPVTNYSHSVFCDMGSGSKGCDSTEHRGNYKDSIEHHEKGFSEGIYDGHLKGTDLVISEGLLVKSEFCRKLPRKREILKNRVGAFWELGRVESEPSAYISPTLLVENPGKDPCFWIEFRKNFVCIFFILSIHF